MRRYLLFIILLNLQSHLFFYCILNVTFYCLVILNSYNVTLLLKVILYYLLKKKKTK